MIAIILLLAGAPAAPNPHHRLLTRVNQIRRPSPDEARRGYRLHIRAVVTAFDAVTPNLFVQDSTGGTWVQWKPDTPKPEPGQLVDIEGITTQEDFAPDIAEARMKVLGRAPMPPARRVSIEEMASTRVDSLWVEVEGIVRSAQISPPDPRLRLFVEVPGGHLVALIPEPAGIPEGVVDSRVRIHGVCGALFNNRSQVTGIALHIPALPEHQNPRTRGCRSIHPSPPSHRDLAKIHLRRLAQASRKGAGQGHSSNSREKPFPCGRKRQPLHRDQPAGCARAR